MKKLLISIFAGVVFGINSFATTAIISNQVATNAAIVTTPLVLDSLTLYSTNTTPTIVYLYDGTITTVTAAWTNYTTYITNQVYTYVTSLGVTNLQTNDTLFVQANAHAAATNTTTPIATLVVPASGSVLNFTPTSPLLFTTKLTLSNNLAGVSGVVSYRTP